MTGSATGPGIGSGRASSRSWWRAVLVGCALVVAARPVWSAPAQAGRVVLLSSPGSSAVTRRAMTRIREELLAGGFDVFGADAGARQDPVSLAAVMQRQEEAVAVIALVGDPEQPGAELWILDRVGRSPEVRRIPVPAGDRDEVPEVLAIRTIEVLKASALKLLLESKYPQTSPAPPPPASPPGAPARAASAGPVDARPAARRFGLEMGISLLESPGGPAPAAVPLARARVRLYSALFARVTVAGLGTRPRVDEPSVGSASVDQSFGLAELGIELRLGRSWHAAFTAGAGALYVRSEGEGVSPYQGLRQSTLVTAVDAGAGVLADLGPQLSLAFEVHGLVAFPHPALRFYDVETKIVADPALLASLTMVAWL